MFKFTKIEMKPGNRMVRAGFGQHDGNWFLRVDLWFFGLRVTRKPKTRTLHAEYTISDACPTSWNLAEDAIVKQLVNEIEKDQVEQLKKHATKENTNVQ